MSKIKRWISGFKKKEIYVELQEKPQELTLDMIKNAIFKITKFIGTVPVTKVRFGVKEYKISKVTEKIVVNNPDLYKRNYGYTKVSCQEYQNSSVKEFTVTDSIIAQAIDNVLWRVDITSFLICESKYNAYDDALIYECQKINMDLLNTLKETYYIDSMFQIPINILAIYNSDSTHSTTFNGYVKTYGDKDIFYNYALNELSPLKETNESTMIQESIGECNSDEYISDKSMIFNVVHKK